MPNKWSDVQKFVWGQTSIQSLDICQFDQTFWIQCIYFCIHIFFKYFFKYVFCMWKGFESFISRSLAAMEEVQDLEIFLCCVSWKINIFENASFIEKFCLSNPVICLHYCFVLNKSKAIAETVLQYNTGRQ